MQLLPGGCRVFTPSDGDTVTEDTRTYRKLICRKSGAKDISHTIYEYGPGPSPLFVNPQAEEVLYVASGTGICSIAGFEYNLQPGVGCYLPPGDPYRIESRGPEKFVLIGVCCPEEEQRRVAEGERPQTRAGGVAPRRVVREQERQAIPVADRHFKLMVDKDVGCARITQFIGFIPPSKAPFHYHTYEEAIFILEGWGVVRVEGGSGEFGPGTSIYLPPRLKHCLENPGPASVRLLGAFYPSGSPAAAYES